MKVFLLLLALLACGALAASDSYVKLTSSQINKSRLIKDLRQLGVQYTLERGIFQKRDLPNGYWKIIKTESVYRRILNGVTYYKYTVQVRCDSDPYLIRAYYVVAYRPSNGNTLVDSNSYDVLDKHPDISAVEDQPEFIDWRLLTPGSELKKYLDQSIKYTVKDAISKGLIKKSAYSYVRVYSIQTAGFSVPRGYTYLVQLVSKEGDYYRAEITVYTVFEGHQDPEYVIYPNV